MIDAFRQALTGIREAVCHERNLRIQICCAGYVAVFGALAGLEAWAWVACLICIGMVLCAELLNTALESLCNRVCSEYDEPVRRSKDTAAGGVLMAAVFSAIVGAVVFFRPLALGRLWTRFSESPWMAAIPVVMLPLCIFFIKGSSKYQKSKKDRIWESKNQD